MYTLSIFFRLILTFKYCTPSSSSSPKLYSMKDVQIERHQSIQPLAFERVLAAFGAIENVLHLHYASHTRDPLLTNSLHNAAKLCQFRIGRERLETMLGFDSQLYVFTSVSSPSVTTIGLPAKQFQDRKSQFIQKINKWIANNPECRELPSRTITDSLSSSKMLLGQKMVLPVKKQNKITKLQSSTSKFKLAPIKASSTGLSLLERIKEKERLSRIASENETPKNIEEDNVESKLVPIYNILYQLGSNSKHLMGKLVDIINDSIKFRAEREIVTKSVVEIANRLESVKVTIYNDTTVVNINTLMRETDLQLLGKKV